MLPKSNMLTIDEGLSAFDSNTIGNITKLFDFLVYYYPKVLIVSHIDHVKDHITTKLNVVKVDGYSRIK